MFGHTLLMLGYNVAMISKSQDGHISKIEA